MALKGKLATALLSHQGMVRTNNEDAIGENPDLGLLVLADGMGGYNAGEVASGIAVATITEQVKLGWKGIAHGTVDTGSGRSAETLLLKRAVEAAHTSIHQVSVSQPQCAGMGTTVVVALVHDDRLLMAYVGDSRLYRYRQGRLEQISRDHSLLEELVARGHYKRDEAKKMVRKNIVTRALGVEAAPVQVDTVEEPLEIGDILLLCSDGLSDMVNDEQIGLTLGQFADNLPSAAQSLVDKANENGGKDNVSVVLARVDGSTALGKHWFGRLLEWF